jgi:hypothetical protein
MNIRLLACTAAVLCSPTTWADQVVIGTATEVQGLVTISQGSTLSAASAGSKIVESAQIVTGSGSSATLKLNSGCELHLRPNQSLVVTNQKTCDELIALLQEPGRAMAAVPPAAALLDAGAVGLSGMVPGAVALSTVAATGAIDSRRHGPPIGVPPVSHQ